MVVLFKRIRESQNLDIVDVDGSYLYRKQQSMGESVEPLSLPDVPLSGWERDMIQGNIQLWLRKYLV